MIERIRRFLFEERDARDLAAMRITLGLLVLMWWTALWPDLGMWFGDVGPVDYELLERKSWRVGPLDGLTDTQMMGVHAVGTLVILAYIAGFGTPVMNILIVVMLATYYHRSPWIQNGGDRLLRIFAFYMCFTDSGRAWSFDARLRDDPSPTCPVFSMRIIQLQLMIMYLYTGLAKWPGYTWHNGTAVYYSLSDAGYSRFTWLFDVLLVYAPVRALFAGMTWLTLAWEIAFAPMVLFRKTRWIALTVGVFLHVGIFATIAVGIFSWSTLWAYLAFLPEGWAAATLAFVRARTVRGRTT